MSVFIIAEIGINHNGKVENALKLIDYAKMYGFDAVKFQKRNPELYPEKPYVSPILGECTYREHKRALELSESDYDIIDRYCKQKEIYWFASCFDIESVEFIEKYKPDYWKIASPCITDLDLVAKIANHNGKILLSTGMSTIKEVVDAINCCKKYNSDIVIMHCCSEYPTPVEHVNLNMIEMYKLAFSEFEVGYSSHDANCAIPVCAVAKGARYIEVHVTLNRAMKGSDHSASLEPKGMETVVRHIRAIEAALGSKIKQFYDEERKIREKVSKCFQST